MKKKNAKPLNGEVAPLAPTHETIAKIAATLAPWAEDDEQIARAIDRALRFYTAAAMTALPTTLGAWLAKYGSKEGYHAFMMGIMSPKCQQALEAEMRTALVFDRAVPHYKCPVRKYLKDKGLKLDGAKWVLNNMREMIGGCLSFFSAKAGNKTTYRFPLSLLDDLVTWKKEKRAKVKSKSWETRNGGHSSPLI